jgi:hypothetical protein
MSDNDLIRRGDVLAACQGMDPEGDINAIPAVQPTVSHKAQPDDVAALVAAVEALEVACFGEIEDVFAGEVGKEMKAIRAALARVKG